MNKSEAEKNLRCEKDNLRIEDLPKHLKYERLTGKLFYLYTASAHSLFIREAGSITNEGYRQVGINGKGYLVHRLIWLIEFGEWPIFEIDHIDGNRCNNIIENLRDISHRDNLNNMFKHRNGHLAGTTFYKKLGKWTGRIYINNRRVHLGSFKTKEQAHIAYLKAKEK